MPPLPWATPRRFNKDPTGAMPQQAEEPRWYRVGRRHWPASGRCGRVCIGRVAEQCGLPQREQQPHLVKASRIRRAAARSEARTRGAAETARSAALNEYGKFSRHMSGEPCPESPVRRARPWISGGSGLDRRREGTAVFEVGP